MHLVEWAFKQDVPHAEKLVLVYLASRANTVGLGLMDREGLAMSTGYKSRSVQRLLKSLRDSGHMRDLGDWFVLGSDRVHDRVVEQLAELPTDMRPVAARKFGPDDPIPDGATLRVVGHPPKIYEPVDAEAIGATVADWVNDQLNSFEHRFTKQIDRLAMLHVEHSGPPDPPPPPPPDPVKVNPLYQDLLHAGKSAEVAYALSEMDLSLDQDTEVVEANHAPAVTESEYQDDLAGRYTRILDILHGADAAAHDSLISIERWASIESEENKHTVKGEPSAFSLLYPAMVSAAKANVGKVTIEEFINPEGYATGVALWDREDNPADKNDASLNIDIAKMLTELEATNDPRCVVQPRTKETGDDGVERTETLKGFYLRVKAKYDQMLQMRDMEII